MRHLRSETRIAAASCLAIAVTTMAVPAMAQAGPDAPQRADQDEIIVTAQKREQRLQDVPISIVAVSGDETMSRGLSSTSDLAQSVPGLQVTSSYASSNAKFSIRGVQTDDFTQNYQSPIGIYVDEVFLGSPIDSGLAMFDIDRAEVLRGPQGTLFGKNTVGGTISLFSALPKNEFGGYANVRYGNYDYFEGNAAVTAPISEDLSVRIAGTLKKRDGTLENLADGKYLNTLDSRALRFSALYDNHSGVRALWTVSRGWNDGDGKFGNPALDIDGDPFKGTYSGYGLEHLRTWGTSLNLSVDLGGASLTSITAYRANKIHRREEPDAFLGTSGDFQVEWFGKFHQISQELRLGSNPGGAFNWIVGGYFYEDSLNGNNAAVFPDPSEAFSLNWRLRQRIRDYAAFAQADWEIASGLTLTIGGRFTNERNLFDYANRFAGLDNPFAVDVDPALSYSEKKTYNAWSGKVGLDYKINHDWLVYGSISRGFNSGGHSGLAFSASELKATEPEYLIAYQAGTKGNFFDKVLNLDLSVFYYDYKDVIVNTTEDTGGATVTSLKTNAAAARLYGFELASTIKPVDGLSLGLSATYLNTKYTDYTSALVTQSLQGNRLAVAPTWTIGADFGYTTELVNADTLGFFANARYTSGYFASSQNDPELWLKARTIMDARIEYTMKNQITLSVWGRNILNKTYKAYGYAEPSVGATTGGPAFAYFYGDPRTYGVSAGIKF